METLSVETDSPAATRLLGERLGRVCRGGEVLLLSGDLGAGKTCLAQGLARGLDVPDDHPVTSPTFVLHNQYFGRLRLDHFDLYRLAASGEDDEADGGGGTDDPDATANSFTASRHAVESVGWEEWWGAEDGVCAVEWPEVFGALLPSGGLSLRITALDGDTRRVLARALDAFHDAFLDRLRDALAAAGKNS